MNKHDRVLDELRYLEEQRTAERERRNVVSANIFLALLEYTTADAAKLIALAIVNDEIPHIKWN